MVEDCNITINHTRVNNQLAWDYQPIVDMNTILTKIRYSWLKTKLKIFSHEKKGDKK